ncbi:hypothetical protein I7I53_03512 [Histoplasma capsulatum var. duboisii H88]|uniref:Uncharacterized protein n=1 Tax=Ajellomyces capsulatus (strain H88) TaxID=544711 RepID=A0A8A1LSP7_AJEC8|nr:hypothetical protein I7I53_03512 [Histoplasma capsulatum var. duboisii H88]
MAQLMACKQFVFSFLRCGFFATSHSHHREPLYDWGLKQGSGQVSQIDFCNTGAGAVYGISVQVRNLMISHVSFSQNYRAHGPSCSVFAMWSTRFLQNAFHIHMGLLEPPMSCFLGTSQG